MPDRYILHDGDWGILDAARALLAKVATSATLRAPELLSVARLLAVFSRLSLVTPMRCICVCVLSPRRHFGEVKTFHWWRVVLEDKLLSVSSGGHRYEPSTGGDSF